MPSILSKQVVKCFFVWFELTLISHSLDIALLLCFFVVVIALMWLKVIFSSPFNLWCAFKHMSCGSVPWSFVEEERYACENEVHNTDLKWK